MTADVAENGSRRVTRRPNEAAIFSAALEAFSSNGFNGASMRAIATRAGTSLSNLYNYVPAKAELLAQVLRHANDDLLASLNEALEAAGQTAGERLSAAVWAYVHWTARAQTAGQVALSEFRYLEGSLREGVVEARDRTERIFIDIVKAGTGSGDFGTPYPREAARNIVLLCAALATWYQAGGRQSPDRIADEQVRLALAMVEAPVS
jgi:AcrR family transcriptional regulator